ncbi:alpha-L-rhamnosidase [Paenibacillus psychroresistens]|uniref:alpha-L-rhamnosidase n=1 Tax=Paenibacillus psychroresistens TaxID=1778678 RepID=A0A6B8RGC4_9BACL|nr:alpha-L-rhamnosidase [Paenibacillus psychroresistens]QGQ95159.1 alpha-L-rhamnosidase [Paenibacillus psychroresistens]
MVSPIQVVDLRVEKAENSLGLEVIQPAFSWKFQTDSVSRGLHQISYRILVADCPELLEQETANMWNTGLVVSGEHTAVIYQGAPLLAGRRYYWRVQMGDSTGHISEWSSTASWGMGMLNKTDWHADWIGLTESLAIAWTPEGGTPGVGPLPIFRHEFMLDSPVERATAYICGLGQFELRMNGNNVSQHVLEPGWTDYDETSLYCTYDVTDRLTEGQNAIGIMLGNGFYNVKGTRYVKYQGSFGLPKVIMQLEIELVNGQKVRVSSGSDWLIAPGPIVFSCIYGGEDYDARLDLFGWDQPNFIVTDSWTPADLVEPTKGKLRSYPIPPNKVMKTYTVKDIKEPSPGIFVYDLGVNFSGRPSIRVKGVSGATIKLLPGEVLDEQGHVYQEWTGSPNSFSYTLKGEGEESWHPRFSYHGFRYIQVEGAVPFRESDSGLTLPPVMLELFGEMIYPDLKEAGSFECSRADWNGIHAIILQAVLSNIKSVLTDCPHREKLGWLEEHHLMGPSIWYNYDLSALLPKMFMDMHEAQLENGLIPDIAPEYTVFSDGFRDSPEWGSAYVITPWFYYNWYGQDLRILSRHYDSMKRYVNYLASKAPDYIIRHGLGDWGNVWQNTDGKDRTPIGITATATFYYDCIILSHIAHLLGKEQDVLGYRKLAIAVKEAFNREWFNDEQKSYGSGSQTSFAMPLSLGVTTLETTQAALEGLISELKKRGYVITSGEIGHRNVLTALARFNRSDVIQKMLEQTNKPYYRYQVAHGATSLAEYWDGPTIGHSQNHFMMGHIEEWFYSALAGIQIDYDGTREHPITIKPYLAQGIDWVKASHSLPQGSLDVQWCQKPNGWLELTVDIPISAYIVICIPTTDVGSVTESGSQLALVSGIKLINEKDGCVNVRAGSGKYTFRSYVQG